MHRLCSIGAVFLLACAAVAPGRADTATKALMASGVPQPAVAACDEPGPGFRRHRRVTRRVRYVRHVRYVERWLPPPPVAVFEASAYNPGLPGTLDPAYDRAMVLHYRSPEVSDIDRDEPGYSPTPPVHGLWPYRVRRWGGVYDYDAMVGQYVRLAAPDAARVAAIAVPLPP